MAGRLVEMIVESVRVHMLSSHHVVILKEVAQDRYLPIWIGPWEADAIARRLQGLSPERPLTHDLVTTMLREVGAEVRQIVIAELAEETFHARITLAVGGRAVEVDARPSDAIALAVRTGAQIFAATEVLERAGVEPEASDQEGGPDEERLTVFREFVNSLDVDLEDKPREGPTSA